MPQALASLLLLAAVSSPDPATNDAALLQLARQANVAVFEHLAAKNDVSVTDLKEVETTVDHIGMLHTRVQQTIHGIPVWEGEAIVHRGADGTLFTVTDNLSPRLSLEAKARLGADDAATLALAQHPKSVRLAPPDLWVLRQDGQARMAWRVRLYADDRLAMPVSFIDAASGATLLTFDDLQTVAAAVQGRGVGYYSGPTTFMASMLNNTCYLENITRRVGAFTANNTTTTAFRASDADCNWDASQQRVVVDAQIGALRTLSYLKDRFGRNGFDGQGGPLCFPSADSSMKLISSVAHFGSNWSNAAWNGCSVQMGDGNGVTFAPFTTLDIAAHEWCHALTQFTSRLTYLNEPGALNEAFSDICGAMVERYARGMSANVWRIGEALYTPSNPADDFRRLDRPHASANMGLTADDNPDHFTERYTGTLDNGGVHVNSGIPAMAFYLLAMGGSHHKGGTMTGIGIDAAERIWYVAFTSYMTSGSSFIDARRATVSAATALYGANSVQVSVTRKAWCLVGVVGPGGLCS